MALIIVVLRREGVHPNRLAVLQALPGSQKELAQRSGVSQAAVSRWIEDLVARKEAHVADFYVPENGGPQRPIYAPGPKPEGFRARKKEVIKVPKERMRRYRERKLRDGSWEDVLKARRDRRFLQRAPKVDKLTAAFFGLNCDKK